MSKYADASAVQALAASGQRLFGENRVFDAVAKIEAIAGEVAPAEAFEWHLIGHLQTNKASLAVGAFAMVESVDSLRVANELSRRAIEGGRRLRVLLQVNVDHDPGKHGFYTGEMDGVYEAVSGMLGLLVEGLMTIGRLAPNPSAARPTFAALRGLRDHLNGQSGGQPLKELSMGMSADYEVAIAEGATIVRVGSALFGANSR